MDVSTAGIMQLDLYHLLKDDSQLLLFVVLALGYLLGNVNIGGFKLGPASGVLVAGLVFGHFQFDLDPIIGSIGFFFFIYSVGLQAGPRFFSIILEDGLKYITLAAVVVTVSSLLTLGLSWQIGFEPGIAAGLLSGALTSAGSLAAAQDAVSKGLIDLSSDVVPDQIINNLTAGYAITYLYGVVGLSILIGALPRWFGVDLEVESRKLSSETALSEEMEEQQLDTTSLIIRAYEVKNPDVQDQFLCEVLLASPHQYSIQQIKRDGSWIDIDAETSLALGDRISVIVSPDQSDWLTDLSQTLGPEIFDADLLHPILETQNVVVFKRETLGLNLGVLLYGNREHGCYVTRLRRIGRDMPLSESLLLQRGDVLTITGFKSQLDPLTRQLGNVERAIHETDLLIFAFGIAIGCVLGAITVRVGGISLGLGAAGGLLLSGITFGFLRSIYPVFGRVPSAARWLMRELGLLFFLASVGVRGGQGIVAAMLSTGPILIISGMIVTTVPLVIGYLYGTKVLKLNPVILMGALTGAMTSTPALGVVTKEARSAIPALGYAGTYAFANVFLTVAGSLLVRF